MTRRNADDEYEYPLLAEEIISYKVVRAQIIQHGLKRFEFDIYQELVIRLWKARRKGKDLNAFFGFKVLRSVLNDKHAEIKRERKVRDKHRRKSLDKNCAREQQGPLKMAIDKNIIEMVIPRILDLDLRDQTILERRLCHRDTFKHIAKIVGCKKSNARIRYNKIIAQLRTCVDDKDK